MLYIYIIIMATLQKKDNTYQDIIQNKEEYYIKSS